MRDFTLVTDAMVVNIAVAGDPPDEGWLSDMQAQFDAVVDVTDVSPRPAIGWHYDGETFAEIVSVTEVDQQPVGE